MKPKAIYVLDSASYELIYGPQERDDIARLVDVYAPPQTRASVADNPEVLADAEIIFSGWGAPVMDATFLASAPNLRAVFYGAGSVRGFVTDELWDRDVAVTSAYAANAVPVAEYTLGVILLGLKMFWSRIVTSPESARDVPPDLPGGLGTVGIISLGMVGQLVCSHLRHFDIRALAYDPYVSPDVARELGVGLVPLETIFRESDVVSLHTPWLPETEGMITREHFAAMKLGSTFINTARGAVVNERDMAEVLRERPDMQVILDVTYPEPPEADSPLYTLPNVVLTPHMAGSQGLECRRMGRYMVDELRRYLAGEPLQWRITRESAKRLA